MERNVTLKNKGAYLNIDQNGILIVHYDENGEKKDTFYIEKEAVAELYKALGYIFDE